MKKVLLVHHAAMGGHCYPPCSLEGFQACLGAGARFIEVDISPLADGDFLLYHHGHLDGVTTGQGPVAACTSARARDLRLVWEGQETPYAPATLGQALGLLASHGQTVELQLDLKPHAPLTEAVLAGLARLLAPFGGSGESEQPRGLGHSGPACPGTRSSSGLRSAAVPRARHRG